MHAPQKQGKKKYHRHTNGTPNERSAWELLKNYRRALSRYNIDAAELDLDNNFYWLFRLEALLAKAHRTFDEINASHFGGQLLRPRIIYCTRSTGGYYNKNRHTIGISLSMMIEHGEPEFFETLLHEIAHIQIASHSPKFYELLRAIGGSGRKAPMTILLRAKRERYLAEHYPVRVRCPNCRKEYRYRTRRALSYACRPCCQKFARGKFDARFRLVMA